MKQKLFSILFIACAVSLFSCKKAKTEEGGSNSGGGGGNQNSISVITSSISEVSVTKAKADASVTNATSVSAKGVVWGTSPNPTIALITKSNEGGNNGNFQSAMQNLSSSTVYYVRAYATDNNNITTYGNELIFTTKVGWKTVFAGDGVSYGIKEDSTLWAWGLNRFGCIGNGLMDGAVYTPIKIGVDKDWVKVLGTGSSTYAIKANGSLWSWGHNYFGELGLGNYETNIFSPTRVGSQNDWSDIVKNQFILGQKTSGASLAWFYNYNNSFVNYVTTPTAYSNTTFNAKKFSLIYPVSFDPYSQGRVVLLNNAGQVLQWNQNTNFAGTGMGPSTAYQALPGNNWVDIFPRILQVCCFALRSDGTLWCWGNRYTGNFGDGGTLLPSVQNLPVQVGTATNWKFISSCIGTTLGLKTDGTIWGTGSDTRALGLGTTNGLGVFTKIGNNNNWRGISLGKDHSLAVRNDGSLWASGSNENGKLGLGFNIQESNTFIPVEE